MAPDVPLPRTSRVLADRILHGDDNGGVCGDFACNEHDDTGVDALRNRKHCRITRERLIRWRAAANLKGRRSMRVDHGRSEAGRTTGPSDDRAGANGLFGAPLPPPAAAQHKQRGKRAQREELAAATCVFIEFDAMKDFLMMMSLKITLTACRFGRCDKHIRALCSD